MNIFTPIKTTLAEPVRRPVNSDHVIKLLKDNNIDALRQCLLDDSDGLLLKDSKDWAGDGLLAMACWHDLLEISIMLVDEFTADVNAANTAGTTPLHRACSSGNMDLLRLLIGRGANLFARDKSGRTPGDYGTSSTIREAISERVTVLSTLKRLEVREARDHRRKCIFEKRCRLCVPIYISGATTEFINGAYEPQQHMSHNWPVYRHRSDSTISMFFNYTRYRESTDSVDGDNNSIEECDISDSSMDGIWIIEKCTNTHAHAQLSSHEEEFKEYIEEDADSFTSLNIRYAELYCSEACFPELRVEGGNGVSEFDYPDGISHPKRSSSAINIYPESFADGVFQSIKLKAASDSMGSYDSIPIKEIMVPSIQ